MNLIMWNLKKSLSRILDKKGWKLARLIPKLNMSGSNLYKCFDKNNIMIQDLLNIANILQVHPKAFFEDEDEPLVLMEPGSEYSDDNYIQLLEEIRDLDRENRELRDRIRKMEEEMGKKKMPCPEDEQKTMVGK